MWRRDHREPLLYTAVYYYSLGILPYACMSLWNVHTVEPRLSEPSVIRMLFLILKSQKQFDFLQN